MTWIHYADEDGDALIARDETSDPFACVWVRAGLATPADADLIAAAPDLLAACELTLEDCRVLRGGPVGSTVLALEAAIAKARGEG